MISKRFLIALSCVFGVAAACSSGNNRPLSFDGGASDGGSGSGDGGATSGDGGSTTPGAPRESCACDEAHGSCDMGCACDLDCQVTFSGSLQCQKEGSPCWEDCHTDHNLCAGRCGGGITCWAECHTDHNLCAGRCMSSDPCSGVICWHECHTDHQLCAARCGHDKGTCGACSGGESAYKLCWDNCHTDNALCAKRCED